MEKSYKAMLIDWGKWTERTLSSENILDQHLFFNAHITKRNGESPFFQSLLNKNICQIKDIVFGSRLMNFNEIQTSKNLTHNEVMHFLSLCSCMHNNMKTLIRAGNHMLSLTRKEDFLEKLVRESSKSIYKKMLSNFEEVPNSERKIKNEFNLDLSQSDFEKIYTLPFSCSIESKLRSFQFKINHYYYFTNQKLHRIKIKDDPNCTFCKTTPETIKHLFVECPKVKPLWVYIESCLRSILPLPVEQLTIFQKLMGIYTEVENNDFDIVNHLIITTNYYIHLTRIQESQPRLGDLKRKLLDTEYLERQIAINKGKLERHERKWTIFLEDVAQ